MCGITGLVHIDQTPDRALVERMTRTLTHRGPDDEGFHCDRDVALGFRRLSIIDLETGNQPVSNEDKTIWSVFNGEIYNYRELRNELEQRGHRFRSRGDAEVLPHLYEEYGAEFVQKLRGMFAIAIWDSSRQELLLARDRVGEKPLYYSDDFPGGGLAFASEIKALLAGGVSRDPDMQAISQYLYYLYIPPPRSAFAAVKKLPPGHLLHYGRGSLEITSYWSPQFQTVNRSEHEHVTGLRERVLSAVESRLVADVPVGTFLSGGIDSTCVLAAMREVQDTPAHTFTITFEGFKHYDESEAARATARHFGTDHHELVVNVDGPRQLPAVVDGFDEPFGNATAVLTSALSEATQQHVKVALTGDGGDELFFGYPRYRGLEVARSYRAHTPRALRRLLASCSQIIPESSKGRHSLRQAREFLSTGDLSLADAYKDWIGYFSPTMQRELLLDEFAPQTDHATDLLDDLIARNGGDGLTGNDLSTIELQSFLPFNVLEYADKMSMAHGLELRAPFVDHQLIEYVGTIPAELKLNRGTSKWVLREAFRGDIPSHVLQAGKRGLNPPLNSWLTKDAAAMIRELLSPDAVRRRGIFRPEAIRELLARQARGGRDLSLHVWALLVLELWFRRKIEVT